MARDRRRDGVGSSSGAFLSLSVGHPLKLLGIPVALNGNLGGRANQFMEIVRREFNASRPDVLLQSLQSCGAGDRDDPRLLGKQPGERHLSGFSMLPRCERFDNIHQSAVCPPSLRGEARERATIVARIKLRVFRDRAGKVTLAKRTVGDETNAEFL